MEERDIPLNGNAFLTKEQAEAVADVADAIYDLFNVHRVHPVYVVGVLETAKQSMIDQGFEACEKGLWG